MGVCQYKFCNVRLMSLLGFVRLVRAAMAHLLMGVQNCWCPGLTFRGKCRVRAISVML